MNEMTFHDPASEWTMQRTSASFAVTVIDVMKRGVPDSTPLGLMLSQPWIAFFDEREVRDECE